MQGHPGRVRAYFHVVIVLDFIALQIIAHSGARQQPAPHPPAPGPGHSFRWRGGVGGGGCGGGLVVAAAAAAWVTAAINYSRVPVTAQRPASFPSLLEADVA